MPWATEYDDVHGHLYKHPPAPSDWQNLRDSAWLGGGVLGWMITHGAIWYGGQDRGGGPQQD